MKKLSFLFLFFVAFSITSKAQMATIPTPPQYAVNSGIPYQSESDSESVFELGRYWYVIHLNNGQSIYCHKIRCNNQGDFIAVFEVKEMPSGKMIEKELLYKYEDVRYTSALR